MATMAASLGMMLRSEIQCRAAALGHQQLHRLHPAACDVRRLSMPASSARTSSSSTSSPHPHRPQHRVARHAQHQQRRTFFWGASTAAASLSPFASGTSGQAGWESLDFLPQIAPDLLPLFAALLLANRSSQDDDDDDREEQKRPFKVTEIPSKGLGAIATRDIRRGEVLIRERPLVVWPSELSAEQARALVGNLTPSARKAYMSLANASSASSSSSKLDPILGIRATNGFNVELPSIDPRQTPAELLVGDLASRNRTASFVFARIARINHSCLPNADHSIDWRNLRMTVYATTDIAAGQEINIEYMPSLVQRTHQERRQALERDFGFVCHCRACSGSPEEVAASDGRRKEMNAIVGALGEGGLDRRAMWAALERMQALLGEEGYEAMPEFDNARISDAYVGFVSIQQQRRGQS